MSRDQPVTATTSSNNRPLSFFDTNRNAPAYFAMISALADIDNSLPIPRAPQLRGHAYVRHRKPFVGT